MVITAAPNVVLTCADTARPVDSEFTVTATRPVAVVVTAGTSWVPSNIANTTRMFDGLICVRISPAGKRTDSAFKYKLPFESDVNCAGDRTVAAGTFQTVEFSV